MRRAFALISLLALSACTGATGQQTAYVNASDSSTITDLAKLEDAKTICIGEGAKMAEPNSSDNPFDVYEDRVAYLKRRESVVRACMLEKGYRVTQVAIQPSAT